MNLKFYKKFSPKTDVILDNGTRIQFSTLDGVLGYFATDSELVQQQFDLFQKQQRYGITEIANEEFQTEYLEKKNHLGQSNHVWREEWGRGSSRSGRPVTAILSEQELERAVAVKTPNDAAINRGDLRISSPPAPLAIPTAPAKKPEEIKPKVGKRPKLE